MDQQPNNKRLLFIIGGIVLILLFLGVGLLLSGKSPSANVTIQYRAGLDTSNTKVRFNDMEVVSTKDTTYVLKPGSYELKISKPGYQDFSTNFTLEESQVMLINAQLEPTAEPAIVDASQLSLYEGITNAQVLDTQYFYDKTWAVVTLNTSDETNTVVVAKFNAATNAWETILGPGVAFNYEDAQQLPPQVQEFLFKNNRIAGE